MAATLRRTPAGRYLSADGRWIVAPVMMGDSPRSKGHRCWQLIDTTGQADLGGGRTARVYDRLDIVRDVIDHHAQGAGDRMTPEQTRTADVIAAHAASERRRQAQVELDAATAADIAAWDKVRAHQGIAPHADAS